jgi:FAD/FMN-containing dehydrogenase/Fe-S oxidoreductase
MRRLPSPGAARRLRVVGELELDRRALARELSRRVRGEVRFDDGSRALYATDASNYRQVPIGVVAPQDAVDVMETLEVCRRFGAPVTSRGGGTSLAGQSCNVAVVLDFSRHMNRILEVDLAARRARVEPGVVLDDLRREAQRHGLSFGPDPATHNRCTLGGMIGNNSCGVHSLMAGRTADNVEALQVLTYGGDRFAVGATSDVELAAIIGAGGRRAQLYARLRDLADRYASLIRTRYPKIPRRVSGYALDELLPENGFQVARALVGSEGTCVTVLEATVRLVPWPQARSLLVLGYPDIFQAGDHVVEIREAGPIGLEGIDDRLIGYMRKKQLHPDDVRYLPEGNGFLLVEFGGDTKQAADDKARALMSRLRGAGAPTMRLYDDPALEAKIWEIRESGLGATAFVPGEPITWEGWEDSAVAPERLGEYLRALRAVLDHHGYGCALYGHFGDGCVHTRIDFELTSARGIRKFRAFVEEAADLVVRLGGSLSGEHGDGQSRGELLSRMYGPELTRAFREYKQIWDPDWKMNPGKKIAPYRLDENLRLGSGYRPRTPATFFQYPDDGGSFAHAALRCVGVGKCRREEGGVMCPSWRVTHEEMHTTRGRAHLLHEMLVGEVVRGGWRDRHVKESLDLCLACKGCKGECPVNVDIATYKAEFLAHYYRGRPRPRPAYAMGLIYWWARLGQHMPGLANVVTQTPALARLVRWLGGIAPECALPALPAQTFVAWFRARGPRNLGRPPVMLWPDTFNNHFFPETALAAVEVLEALGYQVVLPPRPLCCGRPLYDYGMLRTARRLLRETLDALRRPLAAGIKVVGLEPSCVSVFRDELTGLFPHDQDARRLRDQTRLFSQFLADEVPDFQLPALDRQAIVQGHCHEQALFKLDHQKVLLQRLGVHADILDAGCCGMAGSFGFERGDRHTVSVRIAERTLVPAVQAAPPEALVMADGFSCREQIRQHTNRRALHLAEVLRMAILQRPSGPAGAYPERAWVRPPRADAHLDPRRPAVVALGALAAAGSLGAWCRGRGCRLLTAALALAGAAAAGIALAARRHRMADGV